MNEGPDFTTTAVGELEDLKEKSPLPNAVNMKRIENLYRELGDWAGACPKGLEPV